jgi:transcriptional regulator with XRE-family HTH domain
MTTGSVQRFGDLLRRSRLAAGLTQEELAAQAGLSVRGLSDLERGARLAPRRETVQLLATEWSCQCEEGFAFPAPFSSTDEENMLLLYLVDEIDVWMFIEHWIACSRVS